MRSKSACRNRDITPGPGEYKNNVEEFKTSSPKYSLRIRPSTSMGDSTPGPGAYKNVRPSSALPVYIFNYF